jgi:TatD DNase family protein
MQLIDSHCHLTNAKFKEKLFEIIRDAGLHQVDTFLQASYSPEDWDIQIELCKKFRGILPVLGLHPEWVAGSSEAEVEIALDKLAKVLKHAYAIGEVGIDLREKFEPSFNLQMEACEKQFELAKIANLPLVCHVVRAHNEFLNFLEFFEIPAAGGFIHSFNGTWELAKNYIDKGFLISISGSVSYEKNKKLREAVKKIPLDFLLIETDSPDQVPMGWGTELYSPKGIWEVAKFLSELRAESPEFLLNQSRKNLLKLIRYENGDLNGRK